MLPLPPVCTSTSRLPSPRAALVLRLFGDGRGASGVKIRFPASLSEEKLVFFFWLGLLVATGNRGPFLLLDFGPCC
jgi:hypothetical protein